MTSVEAPGLAAGMRQNTISASPRRTRRTGAAIPRPPARALPNGKVVVRLPDRTVAIVGDEIHDPQHWLRLAADLRAKADLASDENAARMYREIAADYVRIAALVAERQKNGGAG